MHQRRHFSIPLPVVSNKVKIKIKNEEGSQFLQYLIRLSKSPEITPQMLKAYNLNSLIEPTEEIDGFSLELFVPTIEYFKLMTHSQTFKFSCKEFLPDDGNIVLKNRITIEYKNELNEPMKKLISQSNFVSFDLPDKRFHEIYCENEQEFNSFFFLNGKDKSMRIERSYFPYIKNFTLKISPNIINVHFPEEIESESKANSFFKNLGFNKIVHPENPLSPWLFYLSNEADYIKMLSEPFYYHDKCLLILPYYGSSLLLYNGEKKKGDFFYIYSKTPIKELNTIMKTAKYVDSSEFENGHLCIIKPKRGYDLNSIRFMNGIFIDYEFNNYCMIFGDKTNALNLISPFLRINIPLKYDYNIVLQLINSRIYKSKVNVTLTITEISILPLSITDYFDILNMSFYESELKFEQVRNIPNYSYLSNEILVHPNSYKKFKDEILSDFPTANIFVSNSSACLSFPLSEIPDALFKIAKYDGNFRSKLRACHGIKLYDRFVLSNKIVYVNCPDSDIDLCDLLKLKDVKIIKSLKMWQILVFSKIEDSFPYLFRQTIEIDGKKYFFQVGSHALTETNNKLFSKFEPPLSEKLLNFYGIKWAHSSFGVDQVYTFKIDNINDYANIIDMVDEFRDDKEINFLVSFSENMEKI